MNPRHSRRRQPLLLPLRSPLSDRFGDDFFRSLPAAPGVYFFRSGEGELLYIGQSGSLRDRVGSYRYVDSDRHPRRLLRLIHRVAVIEWRVCATAAEAVVLEAGLLLEHRPSFNRAGVWPAPVWWLRVEVAERILGLRISPKMETDSGAGENPAPSAVREIWNGALSRRMRRGFPALARCLYRVMHVDGGIWEMPVGLLTARAATIHQWELPPGGCTWLQEFSDFLSLPCSRFPELLESAILDAVVAAANPGAGMRAFWEEQIQEIRDMIPP